MGGRRAWQQLILAGAAGVAAIAVSPAAASADSTRGAAEGITYVSDGVRVAGGSSVDAACIPSTRVVGVGGAAAGLQGHVNSIFPTDGSDGDATPDDGVVVRFYASDSNPSFAHVICASDPSIRYRRVSATIPGHGTRAVTAECPPRTFVTSGGALVSGAATLAGLNSSHPVDDDDANVTVDDGWRVRVFNLGGSRSVEAFAICRESAPRYVQQTVPLGAGGTCEVCGGSTAVRCDTPGHGPDLGGGIKFTGPSTKSKFLASEPYEFSSSSTPPAEGWRLDPRYAATDVVRQMTTFAVCAQ